MTFYYKLWRFFFPYFVNCWIFLKCSKKKPDSRVSPEKRGLNSFNTNNSIDKLQATHNIEACNLTWNAPRPRQFFSYNTTNMWMIFKKETDNPYFHAILRKSTNCEIATSVFIQHFHYVCHSIRANITGRALWSLLIFQSVLSSTELILIAL